MDKGPGLDLLQFSFGGTDHGVESLEELTTSVGNGIPDQTAAISDEAAGDERFLDCRAANAASCQKSP